MWHVEFRRRAVRAGLHTGRRQPPWLIVVLVVSVLTMLLSGCGDSSSQAVAQTNRAKLDAELHHAQADLGIPQSMLAPIEQKERQVASGVGGWNYNYADAAANYALLYTQLTGLEQTAAQTLNKQAQTDLDAFSAAVQQRRTDGFKEIEAYQARLDGAVKQLSVAKTPGDFLALDTLVRAQTDALHSLWPAYQQLLVFQKVLQDLKGVKGNTGLTTTGINSVLAQSEYNQDVEGFRSAHSAAFYDQLTLVIQGQITQLMADQSEAMPYVGSALLATLAGRITLLKQYGGDVSAFQAAYDEDTQKLASAHTLADYVALAQSINATNAAMQGPLLRGQAYADFNAYDALLKQAQSLTTTNPYNGQQYSDVYEYTGSLTNGIIDVARAVTNARTPADYQAADDDINILKTDLYEMINNLNDKTPAYLPHRSDLVLLQDYGLISGKAIVISLREQTMRVYNNGTLIYWTYVTTGREELPSPPGLHYAMLKESHVMFTSSEPKDSPFWYAPTPINYAILYANYGFFVHDAWWRSEFGKYTNLPHYDPAAFDGGSHGCVNLPLNNMEWLYNWTSVGTPILLY